MQGVAALWLVVSLASSSPDSPDDLARAEKLLGRRDYAAAEALLREIIRAQPQSARAHGNLALALLPQRKVREAVDEGRLAVSASPQSPEGHYIYGLALQAAGRRDDAIREFGKASALAPEAPGPLEALADAYSATGDGRAAGVYEKLIAVQPSNPLHRLGLAQNQWSSGHEAQGNATADAALERFPGDAGLHAAYGVALFDQQRYVDAAAQLARARELGARDEMTLGLLGDALWQAGRNEDAEEALRFAVAQQPDSASLRLGLGQLLLSQGAADASRSQLEEAARLAPHDSAIAFQLGRAREAAGAPAEAEAAYRRALELAPSLASPRYALGTLLVRQGRRKEGEEELARHHALYAKAAKTIFAEQSRRGEIQLAEAEIARGQAVPALARLEGFPEGVDVLRIRARALSKLGRHEEAVAALERARELKPEDGRLLTLLEDERARVPKPR